MQHELPPGFRPLQAPRTATTDPAPAQKPQGQLKQETPEETKAHLARAGRLNRKLVESIFGIGLIGGAIVAAIYILVVGVSLYDSLGPSKTKIYQAAEAFIRSEYPGVERLDGMSAAEIKGSGSKWIVRVSGNGKNPLGGPVRRGFEVRMYVIGSTLHRSSVIDREPTIVTSYR